MMAMSTIIHKSFLHRVFILFCNSKCSLCRHLSTLINNVEDYQLKKVLNEFEDVKFSPFRVLKPHFGSCFSKARLEVVQYLKDREGNIKHPEWVSREEVDNNDVTTKYVGFKDMFKYGFDMLESIVDGNMNVQGLNSNHSDFSPHQLEDRELFLHAVESLHDCFLRSRSFHEECLVGLRIPGFDNEDEKSKLTALLASHLFSPLSGRNIEKNTYVVTDDLFGKYMDCPCPKGCRKEIIYGETDIGSEYLWYGRPDLMVFPVGGGVCNILVATDENNEEDLYERADKDKNMEEEKSFSSNLRTDFTIPQIVSQVIVSSFYHKYYKMNHRLHYPVTNLIPGIAICGSSFDVYLYDSENDILLRNLGGPIPLWNVSPSGKKETFKMSSVLVLWMVLNHSTVKPNLRQFELTDLQKSCGLRQHIDHQQLQLIEQTIRMDKHFSRSKEELPVTALPVAM